MSEVVARLAQQRQELQDTEHELANAKERRDAKTVARLMALSETLRQFIQDDEAVHARETELLNQQEGERLYHELLVELSQKVESFDQQVEKAKTALREAAKTCWQLYQVYNQMRWFRRSIELLRLRYPQMQNGAVIPDIPVPPALAPVIFELEDVSIQKDPPRPVFGPSPSDTPEQRTQAALVAVRQYVMRFGTMLPEKVRQFFERAK